MELVWEFVGEYRREPDDVQPWLHDESPAVDAERGDILLAEHLAAQHDMAAPEWTEIRLLPRSWFPAELESRRADALACAPAAFRRHGAYLPARYLEVA